MSVAYHAERILAGRWRLRVRIEFSRAETEAILVPGQIRPDWSYHDAVELGKRLDQARRRRITAEHNARHW